MNDLPTMGTRDRDAAVMRGADLVAQGITRSEPDEFMVTGGPELGDNRKIDTAQLGSIRKDTTRLHASYSKWAKFRMGRAEDNLQWGARIIVSPLL